MHHSIILNHNPPQFLNILLSLFNSNQTGDRRIRPSRNQLKKVYPQQMVRHNLKRFRCQTRKSNDLFDVVGDDFLFWEKEITVSEE